MLQQLFPRLLAATNTCDVVGGDTPVNLGDCLRLGNDEAVSSVYTTPAFLVNLLVRNLFVIAGMVFLFLIFLAGFKMISGGKKGFEEAKTIATSAVIGLVIMISAYWIVQLVGYLTGLPVSLPVR
ncbi:hypothetical protein KA012_00090 [Candidatus Woesebacteria bacterium]|nr:hypothetical protein [Candidatus Woesebacteria bacterium]